MIPYTHDILNIQNKSYYIPGEAVVYGTMNNKKVWEDGNSIRIFGHGTLSGDKLPHPSHAEPPVPNEDGWPYRPIDIQGTLLLSFSRSVSKLLLQLIDMIYV